MTETELMLTSILDCRRVDLVIRENKLTAAQQARLEKMLQRRASGEPLQYVIGHCDFLGSRINVDRRVLIPRPETEYMTETAITLASTIDSARDLSILDIGTGSGNIAIAFAKNIPGSIVTALDIDENALALALRNAKDNGVERYINFICNDMNEFMSDAESGDKKYDVIISNPPYIRSMDLPSLPEVVRQEPDIALDGGEDGMKYFAPLIQHGSRMLQPHGILIFEFGEGQRQNIEHLFELHDEYTYVRFMKDLAGADRFAVAQIAH